MATSFGGLNNRAARRANASQMRNRKYRESVEKQRDALYTSQQMGRLIRMQKQEAAARARLLKKQNAKASAQGIGAVHRQRK